MYDLKLSTKNRKRHLIVQTIIARFQDLTKTENKEEAEKMGKTGMEETKNASLLCRHD